MLDAGKPNWDLLATITPRSLPKSPIDQGRRSPANRGTANAGRILGIIGSILLIVTVALGVINIVSVALVGSLGSDPSVVGSALIGNPSSEMVLDDLAGDGQVRLSDHLGDVVVINFWASWR